MRVPAHILVGLAVLMASGVAAETSVDPVARAAAEIERGFGRVCSNGVSYGSDWVESRDLNGDGLNDFIIRYHAYCEEIASGFCGSAGCHTEVWFADRSGVWILALAAHVRDVSPTRHEGGPALRFVSHGGGCDRSGSDDHISIKMWDGAELKTIHENYDRNSCAANANAGSGEPL